jgi:tetratricopeptide (TPR) repeat protein
MRFFTRAGVYFMKTSLTFLLLLLAVLNGPAAERNSEFAVGRSFYAQGEFKKAVVHFQLSLDANPCDAEAFYWIGVSYQKLADIALPFGGRYHSKALVFLTRAVELAPTRRDYRLELFEYLLDPVSWSRSSQRRAVAILDATPESDPDYSYMQDRLTSESKASAGAEDRLGRTIFTILSAHKL